MFYKVIKDGKIIDVLDSLVFVKYQKKHNRMVFSDIEEAQGILSSDRKHIWHMEGLYKIPVEAGHYDSVRAEEIDEYEYEQLRVLNMKSPESIIDEYNLLLLEMGVI